jgi:hypothetical protein
MLGKCCVLCFIQTDYWYYRVRATVREILSLHIVRLRHPLSRALKRVLLLLPARRHELRAVHLLEVERLDGILVQPAEVLHRVVAAQVAFESKL